MFISNTDPHTQLSKEMKCNLTTGEILLNFDQSETEDLIKFYIKKDRAQSIEMFHYGFDHTETDTLNV